MHARPSLREFAVTVYLPAQIDMRPDSVIQVDVSLNASEVFAGREVYCDELCLDWFVDFQGWRRATRPPPVCQALRGAADDQGLLQPHNVSMTRKRGFAWWCRACGTQEKHAPAARPATVNKDVRTLYAIWRACYWRSQDKRARDTRWLLDICAPIPIRRLNEELAAPTCWSLEQFTAIVRAALASPGSIGVVPAPQFWAALLLTYYDTGARRGAVLGAPSEALSEGKLTLAASSQKQRKSQVIQLSPQTLAALARLQQSANAGRLLPEEKLFPWPRGSGRITDRYREILARAGLTTTSKDLFHRLRRTCATHMRRVLSLADVCEQLGHSSPAVTKRYIDDRYVDQVRTASSVLPRPELPT